MSVGKSPQSVKRLSTSEVSASAWELLSASSFGLLSNLEPSGPVALESFVN